MSYESDYCFQTLLFMSKMAAEGNVRIPEKMGITSEQIAKINALSTQDMHDMSVMASANFVSIAIDPSALQVTLNVLEEKKHRRQQIFDLLREGASYPVLKHLYGLNTADISACRKLLDLQSTELGRPSLPDTQQQAVLWEYVTPDDLEDDVGLADKLLSASKASGVKISAIWGVLNQWKKEQIKDNNVMVKEGA